MCLLKYSLTKYFLVLQIKIRSGEELEGPSMNPPPPPPPVGRTSPPPFPPSGSAPSGSAPSGNAPSEGAPYGSGESPAGMIRSTMNPHLMMRPPPAPKPKSGNPQSDPGRPGQSGHREQPLVSLHSPPVGTNINERSWNYMCDMSIYLYLYMYVYIFMLLYVCSHPHPHMGHPHMGHPRRGVMMSFGLGSLGCHQGSI